MKKVSIITLGCAKNTSDTENLSGLLKKKGYEMADNPEDADAIVVHTCSFIEAAKKESVQAVLEAAKFKNGKKQLIVSGCMVQQHGKEMLEELPEVDAFLGTGQLAQIPDLIEKPRSRFLDRRDPGGMVNAVWLADPDSAAVPPHKDAMAYLRLSEGCSHPCSFCVIPKLRGGLQSRPEAIILREARALAEKGVQELVLIGQDTGEWGKDIYGEKKLHALLDKLSQINGVRWIRLMYMHPYSMTDDVLNVMANSPEKFPYLDMPLQHIDNDVLMSMKRHMGEGDLRRLVEKLRMKLPKASLRTTFIVGYPGETDTQFEKLNQFVKDGAFNYLGAFTYSQEEATPAGIAKNQIPEDVKKFRQETIQASYFDAAHKFAAKRIGETELITIEETEGDTVVGRTRWEAPEIDAIVRLPQNAARGGRFVQAKITGYDSFEYSADAV
jgi:ribosomal protein S12 methylthiotransferase